MSARKAAKRRTKAKRPATDGAIPIDVSIREHGEPVSARKDELRDRMGPDYQEIPGLPISTHDLRCLVQRVVETLGVNHDTDHGPLTAEKVMAHTIGQATLELEIIQKQVPDGSPEYYALDVLRDRLQFAADWASALAKLYDVKAGAT